MRSRALVVTMVLGTSLVTGGWLLQRGFRGGPVRPVDHARLFDQVREHVQQHYVDSTNVDELYARAVDGMLRELRDPYTTFLRADRLSRLAESTSGNYAGVGVQMDVRDGWITVIAPIPGTPADRAGIESGDRIVEVDGKITKGWTQEEAQRALRGAPGSAVQVVVERPGRADRFPIRLVRSAIHRSAVSRVVMLGDGVGYVDVDVFSDSTELEVRRAIDSLRTAGMKTLTLDLRGNPGGLLTQGVGVSELFLDAGQPIVRMRGRTPEANRDFGDQARQLWPDLPMVVLIDERSASASEIVAGALQDHDRAIVVGRISYGKGSAQSLYPVGGGALKLTTARWYTPVGRSISRPLPDGEDGEVAEDEPVTAADSAEALKRRSYRTAAGRTVYGGGGIAPDVVAGDTALPPNDRAFADALGSDFGKFRDAMTDYALALKASKAFPAPDAPITPQMREELWSRMRTRGVKMERAVYDSAAPLVSRLLANEVVRYSFGPAAEARRSLGNDPVVKVAMELLAGTESREELLSRAARRAPPPTSR
jgi:carboxyl-terminal processing protease